MKYVFAILIFFSSNLFAQEYIAEWTSSLHDYYEVQQSSDNVNWTTVGKVTGVDVETTYQYMVPGAGYFYRIKSGNVQSSSIYLEPIILAVRIIDIYIRNNMLTWTVGEESNVDYYLIESSIDGVNFKEVKRVAANGSNTYKTSLK